MRGIRKQFLGTLKVSRLRKTKRDRTLENWRRLKKAETQELCVLLDSGLGQVTKGLQQKTKKIQIMSVI